MKMRVDAMYDACSLTYLETRYDLARSEGATVDVEEKKFVRVGDGVHLVDPTYALRTGMNK